ncbi:RIP metalloprotease RseP [Aquisalimonas asiatica]|uniref:Zinc metalloprotease n=1 Tax=Aquisalimonas asiatica TaxID=406100 RepID=A0A1H8QK69_9GAMM|nr:RIP metalloprotease RseP [Aquisalimonas asiatica]SEO54418.1 site-2 protease. Metallo peptidase. MEROPS family M50B [Aquisalimonas asiatica]
MTGIGTNIVAFLVAIGILVALHEYGHYWTAKKLGVKVLRYSIGFGKPLVTWRRGPDQTEYTIAAIPLGGYVKMLDEREAPVAEAERHRAFNTQALWRRTLIVCAGPAANFLFAILIYWLLFVVGTQELRPVIGPVEPETPAAEAGFEEGEEILSVAGQRTPTWERVLMRLMDGGLRGRTVEVGVQGEDGQESARDLDLSGLPRMGDDPDLLRVIGLQPWRPSIAPRVGELVDGGAAAGAGLQPGDVVVGVDDESVGEWQELVEALNARAGDSVTLAVDRDGESVRIDVDLNPAGSDQGVLGVRPDIASDAFEHMFHTVRYGPVDSLGEAVQGTWQTSTLTLQVLWKMLVGEASLNNLSGPINIAQYAGDTASTGLVPFLKFLAIVSISLGVINLLPIPVLDGGHLLYFAAEAIKGSPVSEQAQIIGQQIGILMIILLMGLAFYNDIARLLG